VNYLQACSRDRFLTEARFDAKASNDRGKPATGLHEANPPLPGILKPYIVVLCDDESVEVLADTLRGALDAQNFASKA
jgi:hypothetical protein